MAFVTIKKLCGIKKMFQSLKGFQRFCGSRLVGDSLSQWFVSIPKRVSEVLWPPDFDFESMIADRFNP